MHRSRAKKGWNRLWNLKESKKGLGGNGKLKGKFIDKLKNYYGIAIRSTSYSLQNMQFAVIAMFFTVVPKEKMKCMDSIQKQPKVGVNI